MVEMGRRFDDDKILRGAIDQYRFLRKEYPGSRYRFDALFTIGEVYKDDLNDALDARATFTDFVNRYPHNRLAGDALAAIAEIDVATTKQEKLAKKAAKKRPAAGSVAKAGGAGGSTTGGSSASATDAGASCVAERAPEASAVNGRRANLPRVTGVRHWSTPDYTRVAIDVEQEVKFGSQRISNPDRIFFDLRDTKLASTLVGKTFDVDDGFLKTIRVAEFQPGRTRIVLEVDDLASYDAFLLPDPYRLIIDVHGKAGHGKGNRASVSSTADTARADSSKADESFRGTAASGEDSKSAKSGLVETDLPAEDASAGSKRPASRKATSSNRVIKTTVAVKGSPHRIPKTIVEAD